MLAIHAAWPFAGLCWLTFLTEAIVDDMKLYRHGGDGSA